MARDFGFDETATHLLHFFDEIAFRDGYENFVPICYQGFKEFTTELVQPGRFICQNQDLHFSSFFGKYSM